MRMCWLPAESWIMKGEMKVHLVPRRLRSADPVGPRQLLHALGGLASTASAILLKLGKLNPSAAVPVAARQMSWLHKRTGPTAGRQQGSPRRQSVRLLDLVLVLGPPIWRYNDCDLRSSTLSMPTTSDP